MSTINFADALRLFRRLHEEAPPVRIWVPVPRRTRPPDRLRRLDEYLTARFGTPGPIDRPLWGQARRMVCGQLLVVT